MPNDNPLMDLEPRSVWGHFDDIRRIPRPSGKEAQLREHVIRWAKELGFEHAMDEIGNLVVYVPATAGHEQASTVTLQGHLDMVCEKNEETVFDFDTEPLRILREGDWIMADGTTLGADNGIGLAAAMAAADDPSVVHGPLELLFTVDEETGLNGAFDLDGSLIKGSYLLNMDSEEWGYVFVGCAGGGDSNISLPLVSVPPSPGRLTLSLQVKGLLGGHSGLNIIDNRANAVKALAILLQAARAAAVDVHLVRFEGGDKHNAIPREARALIQIPESSRELLAEVVARCEGDLNAEFGKAETDLRVLLEASGDEVVAVYAGDMRDRILDLLAALPHGVETMSRDIEGMVETSTNLARARIDGGSLDLLMSTRSSVASALENLRDRIRAVSELAGATVVHGAAYPGWQPDMDSPLLQTWLDVYKDLYGVEPEVTAIHAGLECGIIGEKVPGMKMISYGPDLKDVHSPKEKLNISTTALFWDFTKALLARLAR